MKSAEEFQPVEDALLNTVNRLKQSGGTNAIAAEDAEIAIWLLDDSLE